MAWHGMVWHGVVWCGVVWCGVVWYGMVWYARYGQPRRLSLECLFLGNPIPSPKPPCKVKTNIVLLQRNFTKPFYTAKKCKRPSIHQTLSAPLQGLDQNQSYMQLAGSSSIGSESHVQLQKAQPFFRGAQGCFSLRRLPRAPTPEPRYAKSPCREWLRPISLLRFSLLRFVDSKIPSNSRWT